MFYIKSLVLIKLWPVHLLFFSTVLGGNVLALSWHVGPGAPSSLRRAFPYLALLPSVPLDFFPSILSDSPSILGLLLSYLPLLCPFPEAGYCQAV